MEDIRLKTCRVEIGGKTYELACTMNVLADIQEAHDGNLVGVLADSTSSIGTALELIAVMANNYAEQQGWPERFTPRQIGALIPGTLFRQTAEIVANLLAAAFPKQEGDAAENKAAETPEETEKNA